MDQLETLASREHVSGNDDWAGELPDFNVYCSPARLRVWLAPGLSFDLRLHITDVIRQTERARGLDGNPRAFGGAIEIPPALFETLDRQPVKLREFAQFYLGNRRFTKVSVNGVSGKITVEDFGWAFGAP